MDNVARKRNGDIVSCAPVKREQVRDVVPSQTAKGHAYTFLWLSSSHRPTQQLKEGGCNFDVIHRLDSSKTK